MASGKAYWRDNYWIIVPDKIPNLEHVATLNGGEIDGVPVEYELVDPRKARPQQRALFFALLGDIHNWSGTPTDDLKEYFYTRYTVKTAGKKISLADDTKNTVSDAVKLIDDVIDFVFEFNVPVKEGYVLLPRNENYFQYECIKHRECLICGRHADVHHLELDNGNAVGMGMNRNKVDHTKKLLAALCREHHQEIHAKGTRLFCLEHHLTNMGIKVDAATLKRIGIQRIKTAERSGINNK
ncbi:putative HNHc nuclease [Lactobacillaceae bacterium 24-114]